MVLCAFDGGVAASKLPLGALQLAVLDVFAKTVLEESAAAVLALVQDLPLVELGHFFVILLQLLWAPQLGPANIEAGSDVR